MNLNHCDPSWALELADVTYLTVKDAPGAPCTIEVPWPAFRAIFTDFPAGWHRGYATVPDALYQPLLNAATRTRFYQENN